MRNLNLWLAAASIIAGTSVSIAWADGRESGLNRAAQSARKAPASAGSQGAAPGRGAALGRPGHSGLNHSAMNRAGQSVSRAGNASAGRPAAGRISASGLNHKASGAPAARLAGRGEALPAPPDNDGTTIAAGNAERIRDQRLGRAEHLRQVGEQNGNERLATTAERMEDGALRNYEARSNMSPAANSGDPPSIPAVRPVRRPAAKSSWWPSWFRGQETP